MRPVQVPEASIPQQQPWMVRFDALVMMMCVGLLCVVFEARERSLVSECKISCVRALWNGHRKRFDGARMAVHTFIRRTPCDYVGSVSRTSHAPICTYNMAHTDKKDDGAAEDADDKNVDDREAPTDAVTEDVDGENDETATKRQRRGRRTRKDRTVVAPPRAGRHGDDVDGDGDGDDEGSDMERMHHLILGDNENCTFTHACPYLSGAVYLPCPSA